MKFDQHFLDDQELLDLEINSIKINSKSRILEIGPGQGSLTRKILSKDPQMLYSVEIDESLFPYLEQLEVDHSNFKLIKGNVLEYIGVLEYSILIGNIPYSLTEPIYNKMLEKLPEQVLFLHGISFYNTFMKRKRSKWFYFINSRYNINLISNVSGESFNPKTKVNSVIVKFDLKNQFSKQDQLFNNLFIKKDRKIKNALIFSLLDTYFTSKKKSITFLSHLSCQEILNLDKSFKDLSNIEFSELMSQILRNIENLRDL